MLVLQNVIKNLPRSSPMPENINFINKLMQVKLTNLTTLFTERRLSKRISLKTCIFLSKAIVIKTLYYCLKCINFLHKVCKSISGSNHTTSEFSKLRTLSRLSQDESLQRSFLALSQVRHLVRFSGVVVRIKVRIRVRVRIWVRIRKIWKINFCTGNIFLYWKYILKIQQQRIFSEMLQSDTIGTCCLNSLNNTSRQQKE